MKDYFRRLKHHTGVPIATMITVLFCLAGLANKNIKVWWHGLIIGGVASIFVWLVVLFNNGKDE